MKYIFNYENRELLTQFNRKKLLLSARQKPEQLYYMLDTQFEGIYQADALSRQQFYGTNTLTDLWLLSDNQLLLERKQSIESTFRLLNSQKIVVFRRGMHISSPVSSENLVPGDIVSLSKGDIIPADIRILYSKSFVVDQGIYTGKTKPIGKSPLSDHATDDMMEITDLSNICFWGSVVLQGLALGVVVNTGKATYLGHLLLH